MERVLIAILLGFTACASPKEFVGACQSDRDLPLHVEQRRLEASSRQKITVTFNASEPVFESPLDAKSTVEDLVFSIAPGPMREQDPPFLYSWSGDERGKTDGVLPPDSPSISDVQITGDRQFEFVFDPPPELGAPPYTLRVAVSDPVGSCRGGRGYAPLGAPSDPAPASP